MLVPRAHARNPFFPSFISFSSLSHLSLILSHLSLTSFPLSQSLLPKLWHGPLLPFIFRELNGLCIRASLCWDLASHRASLQLERTHSHARSDLLLEERFSMSRQNPCPYRAPPRRVLASASWKNPTGSAHGRKGSASRTTILGGQLASRLNRNKVASRLASVL